MARACALVLLVTATVVADATAAELREIGVPGGTVRIALPELWIALDPAALENLAVIAADRTGGASAELFAAAFVPRGRALLAGPPALLMQADVGGRLPWGMFLAMPNLELVRTSIATSLISSGAPFSQGAQVNSLTFDRAGLRLRLDGVIEGTPWGTVGVRSCTLLTERGTISLHGLVPMHDHQLYEALFDEICDSAEPGRNLAYRRRIGDLWPWILKVPATWYVLATLTSIAAVWVAVHDRRRHRSRA